MTTVHLISTDIDERYYGRWAERPAYAGTDPSYRIHCLVRETFGPRRILRPFRVVNGRGRCLLGYSPMTADEIRERARAKSAGTTRRKALSVETLRSIELPSFQTGDRLSFSVLAVPHRRSNGVREIDAFRLARRDGCASRQDAYVDWLRDRAERSGIVAVETARLVSYDVTPQIRRRRHSHLPITRADITGTLRIRRPDRLGEFMLAGIGRHRAYGYGMMMIRGLLRP